MYWNFRADQSAEDAAKFLAERSHHVGIHTEPVKYNTWDRGHRRQNKVRRLYFEYGGE